MNDIKNDSTYNRTELQNFYEEKRTRNRIDLLILEPFHFDQVGRVFANCPRDLGSIPGHVIPKTLKMVLDTSLLNTNQYKVRIKGKVEQSRERSSTLPYTWV